MGACGLGSGAKRLEANLYMLLSVFVWFCFFLLLTGDGEEGNFERSDLSTAKRGTSRDGGRL